MEMTKKEELKKELEKLKDFKVYAFEGEVYVKAEDYKEKAIENRKLKEEVRFLEECLDRKEKLNEDYKVLGILNDEIRRVNESLREDNKKLRKDLAFERTMLDNVRAEYKSLQNIIKKLKERIDVLYEFIERNDKLVDEVIDEEDLDKLNRYIYIDDDLVDRTLESED